MKPTHSCFLVLILTLLSVCSRAGAYTSGQLQTVTGSGATRDVTVNLTSGTGEFKLRVID